MSASSPSPQGRKNSLVPSLSNMNFLRRGSRSPSVVEPQPNTDGLLSVSTHSSSSDRPQSAKSEKSRSRSPLKFSKAKAPGFDGITDWCYGFRKYNQDITGTISFAGSDEASTQLTNLCANLQERCGKRHDKKNFNFVHGMPEAVIDLALLWCPGNYSTYITDEQIPSWSWTSWDGQVNFPFDHTECPEQYKMKTTGEDSKLFRSEVENFWIGRDRAYELRRKKDCENLRMRFLTTFKPTRGAELPEDAQYLTFDAFTIPAQQFLLEQKKHNNKNIPCSSLLNEQKQHCGNIMEYASHISEDLSTDGPQFELVLLSRSRSMKRNPSFVKERALRPTVHSPQIPIWDGEKFLQDQELDNFDTDLYEEGPWKVYNVMLICWAEDRSYAGRSAIGRIHEDEWLRHKPTKKAITLR